MPAYRKAFISKNQKRRGGRECEAERKLREDINKTGLAGA